MPIRLMQTHTTCRMLPLAICAHNLSLVGVCVKRIGTGGTNGSCVFERVHCGKGENFFEEQAKDGTGPLYSSRSDVVMADVA